MTFKTTHTDRSAEFSSTKTDLIAEVAASNPDPQPVQEALAAVAAFSTAYTTALEPVFGKHEHRTLTLVYDAVRYLVAHPEEDRKLRNRYHIEDARSPNPYLSITRWLYSAAHEHLRSDSMMTKRASCVVAGVLSKWSPEEFTRQLKTRGGIEGVYADYTRKHERGPRRSAKAVGNEQRRENAVAAILDEYGDEVIRLPKGELKNRRQDGDYLAAITIRKGVVHFRRLFDIKQSQRTLARLLGV